MKVFSKLALVVLLTVAPFLSQRGEAEPGKKGQQPSVNLRKQKPR